MRDKKFVAVHRGGELSPENHKKLMGWAIACFGRILPMFGGELAEPLKDAVTAAEDWRGGRCRTGEAMKAARKVHAFARTLGDPVAVAVARAVGHGVATAHMADHCTGAALYAQKALKLAGKPFAVERKWQIEKLKPLPAPLAELIAKTLAEKAKRLGL